MHSVCERVWPRMIYCVPTTILIIDSHGHDVLRPSCAGRSRPAGLNKLQYIPAHTMLSAAHFQAQQTALNARARQMERWADAWWRRTPMVVRRCGEYSGTFLACSLRRPAMTATSGCGAKSFRVCSLSVLKKCRWISGWTRWNLRIDGMPQRMLARPTKPRFRKLDNSSKTWYVSRTRLNLQ